MGMDEMNQEIDHLIDDIHHLIDDDTKEPAAEEELPDLTLYLGEDFEGEPVLPGEELPDLTPYLGEEFTEEPAVQEEKLSYLAEIKAIYQEIIRCGHCLSLKTLAVTGSDLIKDGVQPGKIMGELLGKLLDEVLEVPERNEKQWLLERSRQLREEQTEEPSVHFLHL